jgi:hypothetical protein
MGRPKGSKNKAKNRPVVGHLIPTEGTDVPSQPNASSASDALASSASVAAGHAQEGGAPTPPAVGDTVTHPDGRTGEVTEVEARGSGHAVCVHWSGDEDESQYTPTDWRELQAALVAAHAPTEPAPATPDEPRAPETTYDADDEPQPPPGIGSRLAEIGHEWAETDAQLVAKEAEKSTVVKQYSKEIDILESRCRQLAAEYREAEWPETYDYKRGIKHVWNGRTGRIARTEKLGSYQAPLDFDRPSKPPVEVTVTPAALTESVAEVLEHMVIESLAVQLEPTPFDDPEPVTDDAAEA